MKIFCLHKIFALCLSVFCLFVLCFVTARGQEASIKAASQTQLKAWVLQLNSGQASARDAAQQKLISQGAAILPFLDKVERQSVPAEVKQRLAQIRTAIEARQGADFLAASCWGTSAAEIEALRAAATTPELLEELGRQTGNPIDVSRIKGVDLPIPADFKRLLDELTPESEQGAQKKEREFWPTIDWFVENCGLEYAWFTQPKAVRLQLDKSAPTAQRPWVAYNGPFRLELTEMSVTKRFNVRGGNTARFNLILSWEPRLKPVYFLFLPEEKAGEKTDVPGTSIQRTNGAPTLAFAAGTGIEILAGKGAAKPIELTFTLPEVNDTKVDSNKTTEIQKAVALEQKEDYKTVSLYGRFCVVLTGKPERFVFEAQETAEALNLLQYRFENPIKVRFDAATGLLKSVRRMDAKTVSAQLSIEFDESHNALRSYMNWLNDNQAFLVLADGTRIESNNWETVWQSERGAEVRYFFPVSGEANVQKIEYASPSAIRRCEYPYQFQNIPLVF